MTRSGIGLTLVLALAWVALAQGQSTPASAPEARVGKVITVTEVNRAPEKCKVLQAWRLSDGSPAMQAQSVESGEMLSIVETPKAANPAERFRVFRWGMNGMPPVGCPVPPGTKVPVVAEAPKIVIAGSVKQVAGKVAASTKGEAVVQAPYLPPADAGQKVVHAATPTALPGVGVQTSMKQTSVKTGPVIVGQPDVPVVLADGSASADKTVIATSSPVVQAQATTPAPAPKADAPVAPAPAPKTSAPAAPVAGGPVACEQGNTIIVTEPNCAPAQCQVLSVTRDRLGHKQMQVKNLCTGECFTLVEGGHHKIGSLLSRFCILRGKQSCPVACESCAAGSVPVVAPKSMPTEKAPMPAPKTTTMATGANKFGSLLPPGEAPVAKERPSQPEMITVPSKPAPSLAQTTVTMTPAKATGERNWKQLFNRPEEKPVASKPATLPKPEPTKDAKVSTDKPAKAKELARPEEKKTAQADAKPVEKVKKTELAAVETPVMPRLPVEPVMAKQTDLPVPVPLIPLVTTEPRPTAPPPQPPINPYSTMGSTSMVKYGPQDTLPPMCPTCRLASPGSGGGVDANGLQQASTCTSCPPPMAPMPAMSGPVSQSGWTRGPALPVSQSPVMVPSRRLMTETEAQAMQNTVHLMTVLQSSGVPAQREWAATRLRVCDPQMHPYVVESLVTAAKTDGAAMVRGAAIQSLAQMKATDPSVVAMMENARQDRDPRVRDEAIMAVKFLTGQDATSVQPAVHTADMK